MRRNDFTGYSKAEKVLLAAAGLSAGGFTAEELVLRAWQNDTAAFGLVGYVELHPDTNKILSYIMGRRGLVALGLLWRTGAKVYQVTAKGRAKAAELRGEVPVKKANVKAALPAGLDAVRLGQLLSSAAMGKFKSGSDITFTDAMHYWGAGESDVDAKIQGVERLIVGLADALEASPDGFAFQDGRWVGADQAATLSELNDFLQKRFASHVKILKNRAS